MKREERRGTEIDILRERERVRKREGVRKRERSEGEREEELKECVREIGLVEMKSKPEDELT
jgi:hypothetical protein